MLDHNKLILRTIKFKRRELTKLLPNGLEGKQCYKELLALYSCLDVENELELTEDDEFYEAN